MFAFRVLEENEDGKVEVLFTSTSCGSKEIAEEKAKAKLAELMNK